MSRINFRMGVTVLPGDFTNLTARISTDYQPYPPIQSHHLEGDPPNRLAFDFKLYPEDRLEWGAWLVITADGYDEFSTRIPIQVNGSFDFTLTPIETNFDPSNIPLETLAKIRGNMWTARCNIPYGPRPNNPSNILAMDYYSFYNPDERQRMIQGLRDRKYTHYVTGPMIDEFGYHGMYPSFKEPLTQAVWDGYLNDIQQLWNEPEHFIPIHFVKPDNWNIQRMNDLIPFYQQERAQRLLRVVVWPGWEPTRYDWTNAMWNEFLKQGNEVMPNALQLVHTVTDVDALTGQDDWQTIPGGNAECWQRSVPYLHGWLIQLAGYQNGGNPVPSEEVKKNFAEYFQDMYRRFHEGYAGWPTHSKWGNQPMKFYAGEYASYPDFWDNWDEQYARELGDLAVANKADGYCDGGFNDVP